jgi:phosphatidylinositol alpha-mannosyltransferase
MENVTKTIAEGLAEHRPVEVLTSRSGPSTSPAVERRGNLVVRRLHTIEFAHLPFMPTLLFHLLRLPRPAVVHVHIAQAYVPEMVWLSSLLRRRPFIAHYHLDVEPSGRFGPIFVAYKRLVLGRVLRSAARVIVLSPDQAEFVVGRYDVEPGRVVIVPNGVATEFFREPVWPDGTDDPLRLLFVGRLSPQKNVSRLLRAMAAVTQDVELVIVGEGEQRPLLGRLLAELGLDNVQLVGAKTGPELVDWYHWADAFVLPSDKEGMPLALLEAMAAGLPVIGTDVPGIADTIGTDGLLAEPDPAALAVAIDRMVTDRILRAALAKRSYRRGQEHGWLRVLETLQDVYGSVAA